ncbi:MAG: hypothetical protein ACRD3M_16120 [Thermoanaerobaculia bacterium]
MTALAGDIDWLGNHDSRQGCTGLRGPAAQAAITSFQHGATITDILDTGASLTVLRRIQHRRPYRADGFEVTKADYHAWVDAMAATCAEQR